MTVIETVKQAKSVQQFEKKNIFFAIYFDFQKKHYICLNFKHKKIIAYEIIK